MQRASQVRHCYHAAGISIHNPWRPTAIGRSRNLVALIKQHTNRFQPSNCTTLVPSISTSQWQGLRETILSPSSAEFIRTKTIQPIRQKRFYSTKSADQRTKSKTRSQPPSPPKPEVDHAAIKTSLDKALLSRPSDLESWKSILADMRTNYGNDGVWAAFEQAREKNQIHIFLPTNAAAGAVRDDIMAAAASEDSRIEAIIKIDQKLRALGQAGWPDLLVKCMHAIIPLPQNEDRAPNWYRRLTADSKPTLEEFAGMLSILATHTHSRVQRVLQKLYEINGRYEMYDRIVPSLFDAGKLHYARHWRKVFLKFKDYPRSATSVPFLKFHSRYFAQPPLEPPEMAAVTRDWPKPEEESKPSAKARGNKVEQGDRDDLMAKWFASSWISVEFALNLVCRLGASKIGPRSLQALALRETDARGVADRIAQLERLGIQVDDQHYSTALTRFAKSGQDGLLEALLKCDIHPDEFDDPTKRKSLIDDAIQQGDVDRQHLLEGVESTFRDIPSRKQLNQEIANELMASQLDARPLGKTLIILDRMDALNVDISETNATKLLSRAFWGISNHPSEWIGKQSSAESAENKLNRAIYTMRRLRLHKIPIPLDRWECLICNLGRLGRLDELEQLMVEFVQLFRPENRASVSVLDIEKSDKYTIPNELPLSHRTHPVQELIDPQMQRKIIRWGFDQTLARPPQKHRMVKQKPSDFDLAAGVRILATLRDKGVLIEPQRIRSTIESRFMVATLPGRKRHRARDPQELTSERIKTIVEEAWGDTVIPSITKFERDVEHLRTSLLKKHQDPRTIDWDA